MLVDSHAHLDFLPKDRTIEAVLSAAKDNGVNQIICIGTSIEASKKSIEIAERFSGKDIQIYASCGIHPQDGKEEIKKHSLYRCIDLLKQITTSSRRVVAIGECGLDYFLNGDSRGPTTDDDKEFQRELFKAQVKLACDLNLPLVVHCRNAWEEIFSLLTTDYGLHTRPRGVFHSWTENIEAVKKALDLGFYISFSGIVTFKNAQEIQEAAKIVLLDRMLVETDSPFLAPEPIRGSQNEPANVKITADFLASLLSMQPDDLYAATVENAQKLFGI